MKIRPLGAQLFNVGGLAGGRTDPTSSFFNFANPIKTVCSLHQIRVWNSPSPSYFIANSYLLFYSILHSTGPYISSTLP